MFSMLKQAFSDVSGVGTVITLLLFVLAFVTIVVRVYRKSARSYYEEVSRLPLDGKDSK